MSATISGVAASAAARPSAASLQARLDHYRKTLADCVNCASAKTSEGKANIARIAAEISRVEDSISKGDTRVNTGGRRDAAAIELSADGVAQRTGAGKGNVLPGAGKDDAGRTGLSGFADVSATVSLTRRGIFAEAGLGSQIDTYA